MAAFIGMMRPVTADPSEGREKKNDKNRVFF